MSLISQKDREVVIKALNYYCDKLDKDIFDNPIQREKIQKEKTDIITLLNWICLEHYKNEN